MAEVCRRFEVSRKTGYKWLGRYEAGGVDALRDGSHGPHHNPRRVEEEVEDAIRGGAREAPALGAREIAGVAGAHGAGHRLAGTQHDGRDSAATWLGGAAQEAAKDRPPKSAVTGGPRAESGLVCRL
jgi:hypothetical protein